MDIWATKGRMKRLTDMLTKNRIAYKIKIENWNVTEDGVSMENLSNFDGDYKQSDEVRAAYLFSINTNQ